MENFAISWTAKCSFLHWIFFCPLWVYVMSDSVRRCLKIPWKCDDSWSSRWIDGHRSKLCAMSRDLIQREWHLSIAEREENWIWTWRRNRVETMRAWCDDDQNVQFAGHWADSNHLMTDVGYLSTFIDTLGSAFINQESESAEKCAFTHCAQGMMAIFYPQAATVCVWYYILCECVYIYIYRIHYHTLQWVFSRLW